MHVNWKRGPCPTKFVSLSITIDCYQFFNRWLSINDFFLWLRFHRFPISIDNNRQIITIDIDYIDWLFCFPISISVDKLLARIVPSVLYIQGSSRLKRFQCWFIASHGSTLLIGQAQVQSVHISPNFVVTAKFVEMWTQVLNKAYYLIKWKTGFLKCSKLGSLINFQSLNCHWSVLLDQISLQLDRKGMKEREVEERRVQLLFEGGDYFKYYHQRGAIIRGTAIIRGNTVIHKRYCLVLTGVGLLVLEIEGFWSHAKRLSLT